MGDFEGGQRYSAATAVNENGTVVVGRGSDEDGELAFRWTEREGLQSLPPLEGGGVRFAVASAVDRTGLRIAGSGVNKEGEEISLIWDVNHGTMSLDALLALAGEPFASEWTLTSIEALSADGNAMTVTAESEAFSGVVLIRGLDALLGPTQEPALLLKQTVNPTEERISIVTEWEGVPLYDDLRWEVSDDLVNWEEWEPTHRRTDAMEDAVIRTEDTVEWDGAWRFIRRR